MFDKSFVTPVRENFYQTSMQLVLLDLNLSLAGKKISNGRTWGSGFISFGQSKLKFNFQSSGTQVSGQQVSEPINIW